MQRRRAVQTVAVALSVLIGAPLTAQHPAGAAPGSSLTVRQSGEGSVVLTWRHGDRSPLTQQVDVYDSSGTRRKVRTLRPDIAATTATVKGLTAGRRYLFQLSTTKPNSRANTYLQLVARPASPKKLRVDWVDDEMLVTWSPTKEGTNVALVVSGDNDYRRDFAVSGSSSGVRVAGADPSSVYRITAIASNAAGMSGPVRVISQPAVPSAPTVVATAQGTGRVQLRWSGSSAASWRLTIKSPGSARDGELLTLDGSRDSALLERLTPGRTYRFVLVGINSLGLGKSSTSDPVTVLSPVLPPVAVTAVAGDGSVALTWGPGAGDPPSSYRISWRAGASGPFTANRTVSGTTTTINGLTNERLHQFLVEALDQAGESAAAPVVSATPQPAPVTPTPTPSPTADPTPSPTPSPTASPGPTPSPTPTTSTATWLSVSSGDSSLQVTWSSTAAVIEWQVKGSSTWESVTAPTAPLLLEGLVNGTTYTLRPLNSTLVVIGPAVDATPTGPPTAVRDLSVEARHSELALSWTPPANNGGSALTDIVVTWRGADRVGETTLSADATSFVVTGLTNGTNYNVTVTAVNRLGYGPLSAATGIPTGN
jgi:hypothetical protein